MGNRVLVIVGSYGEHRYPITKETADFIETNTVSLLDDHPLRFNKREERMEYFNGVDWDVYISDSEILGATTVDES